jgi:hypothetical protein
MPQTTLIEQIDTRLKTLSPAKLTMVYGFVSYLSERDPDQAWFWTPEWQAGEREADEDLQTGNHEDFDSMDDFIAALQAEAKTT